jgi:hypothetical protein
LTPRNDSNEPAVAMDAHQPNVLVAGTNDLIDFQPCPQSLALSRARCTDFSAPVGISGIYFSFDAGQSWIQPTYTGWTARDCAPTTPCPGHFGPIGTLPWYYESGLISFGDPAVAIGPRPVNGRFSWSNGSRVYYANLTSFINRTPGQPNANPVAVSRLDNPTPSRIADKSNWARPVLAIQRGGTFTLEDKEQIWADNAESSPFFGNVYICNAEFRAVTPNGFGEPVPVKVATSSDGGDTWTEQQVTPSQGGGASFLLHGFMSGCSIRTDSQGVVYLFLHQRFFNTLPEAANHVLLKSFDGGKHWTQPQLILSTVDTCFHVDAIIGRCVEDGYAGARVDLSAAPSVDIANGAPSGSDATNLIVDSWVDGADGLNQEKARLMWSSNGGNTWSDPVAVSNAGDRPMYSATALAPDGSRVYVMYEGVTSPWRGGDMFSPRPYHGVLRAADVGVGGPTGWADVYNEPRGDLRASYPHDLYAERVGDYVYAAASRTYGVGVWTTARNAAVCNAVQQWRSDSFAAGQRLLPAPWPLADCPATFGNTDTWSATGP